MNKNQLIEKLIKENKISFEEALILNANNHDIWNPDNIIPNNYPSIFPNNPMYPGDIIPSPYPVPLLPYTYPYTTICSTVETKNNDGIESYIYNNIIGDYNDINLD